MSKYEMEFYDAQGFGYATQPLSESYDGLTGSKAAIADAKDWLSRTPKASYANVSCDDEPLCTIRMPSEEIDEKVIRDEGGSENVEKKAEYANTTMPAAFVHYYSHTAAKTGVKYDKAIVSIPEGVKANGVPLGGYAVDVFLNDRQLDALASNKPVRFGFRTDRKVVLFKEEGGRRRTLNVDAWSLVRAIKSEREIYTAGKAAERAPVDRAEQATKAARVRGSDDPSAQTKCQNI